MLLPIRGLADPLLILYPIFHSESRLMTALLLFRRLSFFFSYRFISRSLDRPDDVRTEQDANLLPPPCPSIALVRINSRDEVVVSAFSTSLRLRSISFRPDDHDWMLLLPWSFSCLVDQW